MDEPNAVEYNVKVKLQAPLQKQIIDSVSATHYENIAEADIKIKEQHSLQIFNTIQNKEWAFRYSTLSSNSNVFRDPINLPQVFQVKYLGSQDARGLWGIKHTRKPIDNMVTLAKTLPTGIILPFIKLVINVDGVGLLPLNKGSSFVESIMKIYPIESVSYGVQDLVYTRVFSMIVVRQTEDFRRTRPFECHGFVCESKYHARQITYALAAAFQIYSQHAKEHTNDSTSNWTKRFAFEMRNPIEVKIDCSFKSDS